MSVTADDLMPDRIPVPAGFRRLAWADAVPAQEVYLIGVVASEDVSNPGKMILYPNAAGPLRVVGLHMLAHGASNIQEIGERLLVKETTST